MNKWSELLIGLILFLGIILVAWFSSVNDWTIFGKNFNLLGSAWIILKGFLFWMIFFAGLLLIILGINDLRN